MSKIDNLRYRSPEELLVYRIFEQASTDYRSLRDRHITQDYDDSSCYSIRDIETFFRGRWCDDLLHMIEANLKGVDILRKLKASCKQEEYV